MTKSNFSEYETFIAPLTEKLELHYKKKVVCLGTGRSFKRLSFRGWAVSIEVLQEAIEGDFWLNEDTWGGMAAGLIYFAPLDSDVARLNGYKNITEISRKIQL